MTQPPPDDGRRPAHRPRILVINPNSSQSVSDQIDRALEPLRFADGPTLECLTLAVGPPAIESQAHTDLVSEPLCQCIEDSNADAFVVACYSDPGVLAAREQSNKPVFGVGECAMLSALTRGDRFGVVSILDAAVPRHVRYLRSLGLEARFAADMAIGMGVLELTDDARVMERMTAVGMRLQSAHGADVVIMGCAGMSRFKHPLEQALGIPVIDPTQAAAAMAIGVVRS